MILDCKKIRDVIAARGVTHQQVADEAGVSVTWVDKTLRCDVKRIRTSTAGKICSALGLKPSEVELTRDELAIRYSELIKKYQELKNDGLNEAADIVQKEIEKIEKFLA